MPKPYYQLQTAGQAADIYIFGDIVDDAYWGDETSPYSLVQAINGLGPDVAEVNLHIDCYGGSVAGGWGIYNALRQRPGVTVRTYADGFVASAAIYPFLAGKERFANSVSAFYFHPVLTGAYGYADELRAEADAADKLTEIGRQALVDVAGLSQEAAQALLARVYLYMENWEDRQERRRRRAAERPGRRHPSAAGKARCPGCAPGKARAAQPDAAAGKTC